MGAKVTCELYHNHRINKQEANLLLGFCNNIGPAYFLGIITPILSVCEVPSILPYISGLYIIPLLYGILLFRIHAPKSNDSIQSKQQPPMRVIHAIRTACVDNTQSIILLGGYVTFVNSLRAFLVPLPFDASTKAILGSIIEINSGIQDIYLTELPNEQKIFWIMLALSFSSISCFIQAAGFILREKLSFKLYIQNHCIVTAISTLYYFVITNL
ncbi:MAG: hypothetical protein IJ326_13465 [Lachnospiraceae bacterium]|nr:hypothetical protein [Lachnospiraceae bacterium]